MKNSNLLNRLLSYSHEKQSPQRFGRYAAMLIMLLTLGVGQMWAYNETYIVGDLLHNYGDNKWTSTDYPIGTYNASGTGSTYMYIAEGDYFKVRINGKPAGNNNSWDMTTNGTGSTFYKWDNNDPSAAHYTGETGIVKFNCTSTESDNPVINLTRPDVYIRHNWSNSVWSNKKMTDNEDGTYTLVDYYSGTKRAHVGPDASSKTDPDAIFKDFDADGDNEIHLIGSPTTGDKCLFTFNSYWYRAAGQSATGYVGALSVAKIHTVTFNMKGVGGSNFTNDVVCTSENDQKVSQPDAPSQAGYTFGGWYTDESCTISYNFSTTVTSSFTLYAKWTVITNSVTIAANDATMGTLKIDDSSQSFGSGYTIGVTSKITVTPNAGYYFTGWSDMPSGMHKVTDETTKYGGDAYFYTDGTGKTITANFAKRFVLRGTRSNDSGDEGMPGFSTTTADMDISDGVSTKEVILLPNREYKFMIYDHVHNRQCGYTTANNTLAANTQSGSMDGTYHLLMNTAGYGTYTFSVAVSAADGSGNTWPKVTITNPDSKLLTLGRKVIYNEDNSTKYDATNTNGGTVIGHTNENSTGYDIENGQYFANGSNITFTATPATGYRVAGWYNNADCADNHKYVDNSGSSATVIISEDKETLTLKGLTSATTVYVKFEEIMSSVYMFTTRGTFKIDDGSATSEVDNPYLKVGVHTTHTVTVLSADAGYYFSGWDLHTSPDKTLNTSISGSGEDNTTITVRGLGNTEGHILDFLYPEYKDLEKIYFRNVFDDGSTVTHWSQVYVYFNITWANYSGQQAVKTSSENNTKGLYAEMSAVGSKDLYWAYVPRWVTRYDKVQVAFANMENTSNSGYLYAGKASARGDYKKELNVFVPYHVANKTNVNSVDYYDNGFWYYYDYAPKGKASGYKLGRRTGTNTYAWEDNEFTITNQSWEDPKIQYNLRIDNVSKNKYVIKAVSANIKYKANTTITNGACDDVTVVEDNASDSHFTLTPTTEGEYVITIDQSGDRMKISVNYPVAVNDYVVEHTYTGRNKDNSADSTYTTRSNVIKYAVAADSARYSLYLNNAGATLKLRKCTAISNVGVPTWTEVDSDANLDNISDGLAAIMTKVGSTPGVYEFDLKVDKTNDAVGELKNIALYSGNYYIKTDSASGGWVNYKDNAMDKNTVTFDRTAATFDNYWCHYYYTNAGNIKCVIANEYCNQLSDTIKGDGIARMSGKEPFVPKAGTSIRFSYNSATNTIGRAYLDKSLDNDYLNIVPNATGKVFKLDGTDLYDAEEDNYVDTRFDDKLNWVYEKEVLVVPGAEAGVSATFYDASSVAHKQMFLPKTYMLLGGEGKGKYHVRVVYDFKTNFMMAAFLLPDTAITTALSDFDMLWVRHKDESPDQIKLGTGGSLSNVRVIGAIELRYDSVHYNGSGPGHVYMNTWGPDNRPFLKYFVSFPFDVHVSSIFGLNQARLGYDYDIQKYDGATRAKEGLFFGDGDNYWINLTKDSVMHANEGYCIIFDNDYVSGHLGHIWDNKASGSKVYLYFPADEEMESIVTDEGESNVPAHQCNVNRWWAQYAERNHMQTDSHWNMIGNPLFHDAHIKSTVDGVKDSTLHSYYKLDYSDNKWKAVAITKNSTPFKAMSSVLVQWCGDITWTAIPDPSPIVARRVNAENKNYLIQLDVEFNGAVSDWAYVQLREGSDADFKLCEDMYKMYNKGIPQIYTFAGAYDVAYNDVPIQNQTIPVGIVTRKNGTYKFSMPTNFSGTVTLIDKFAQTRTNLNIEDYEVYLEKGTIEDRFELEINIIQAPTAIDGVEDGEGTLKDGKAHKFIMNDMMYILRDGEIFDARGNRVR